MLTHTFFNFKFTQNASGTLSAASTLLYLGLIIGCITHAVIPAIGITCALMLAGFYLKNLGEAVSVSDFSLSPRHGK